MLDKLRKYIEENFEEQIVYEEDFCLSSEARRPMFMGKTSARKSMPVNECASAPINEYIEKNNNENKFQTLLFKYIDDRNLKDSDVYNKVHLDRRLFSKIRSDINYHPSKETVILLGLSLELSEDEIENLLESASYSLPKNNYYDLIIRFCFKEKIYDLKTINDFLDEYDQKMFSY